MVLQSLYGDSLTVGDGGTPEFRVSRAVRPTTRHIYAEIVGGRERIVNLTPKVRLPNGALFVHESVQIFHTNPAEAEDPNSRPVAGMGKGKRLAIEDAIRGIQLGGGSKIGAGGPVDFVALVGDVDGVPVVSDSVLVGLFSSDVVLGPTFVLHFPAMTGNGPPPTTSQPPSNGADPKADIAEALSTINQAALKGREALFRLG